MKGDFYKTIKSQKQSSIFKEKDSKFISYIFQVKTKKQVDKKIQAIKNKHYDARHWCYAYRLGIENINYKYNDDGEPSGTAGKPILRAIRSHDLTNTIIIVVRYFGGTKLGTGGLTKAYSKSANLAIQDNSIVKKPITKKLQFKYTYKHISLVQRLIEKYNAKDIQQNYDKKITCQLSINQSFIEKFKKEIKNKSNGDIIIS